MSNIFTNCLAIAVIVLLAIADDVKWPGGRIPYRISDKFTSDEITFLENTMLEFNFFSCAKFHKQTTENNYLYIMKHGYICSSKIGYKNGIRKLWLTKQCLSRNAVLHHLMHVIGFTIHENNRPDRDDYIEVMEENIAENYTVLFRKSFMTNETDLNIEYDYASVMHYPPKAFSKNGQPTIRVKLPDIEIKADGLSRVDKLKINKLYECTQKFSNRTVESRLFMNRPFRYSRRKVKS